MSRAKTNSLRARQSRAEPAGPRDLPAPAPTSSGFALALAGSAASREGLARPREARVWQGGFGQALRKLWQREDRSVVPVSLMSAPFIAAMPDATPGPILLPMDARSLRSSRPRTDSDAQDSASV